MDKRQKGLDGFVELLSSAKDKQAILLLLEVFLTPEEKDDLATRYLIVRELLQSKKTQRQIAKDLNVSIAKITRGSNELKRANRKILEYLSENILG